MFSPGEHVGVAVDAGVGAALVGENGTTLRLSPSEFVATLERVIG